MPTNCARSRAFSGNFSNCNCFGRRISVLSIAHSFSAGEWLCTSHSYLNKVRRLPLGGDLDEGPIQIPLQCQETAADVLVKVCRNRRKNCNSPAFRVKVDGIYLLPLSRTHYPRKCAPYGNYYCGCVSCSWVGRSACPCRIWWRNRDSACASGKIDAAHPHCRTIGFLCNCEYPEAQKECWEKKNVKIYSCHQSRANAMVVVLNDEFLTLFTEISSKLNRKQNIEN